MLRECAFSMLSVFSKRQRSSVNSVRSTRPEVCQALDLLEPYCRPDCIKGFREHLEPHAVANTLEWGAALEGQQQNLRLQFACIYRCVRALLIRQIGRLGTRYIRSGKDPAIMTEIERLKAELEKMLPEWNYFRRPRDPTLPERRSS